jgi:hypothetical protein
MLGEFVDEYTVEVIDVFVMPQSGPTVTVECLSTTSFRPRWSTCSNKQDVLRGLSSDINTQQVR